MDKPTLKPSQVLRKIKTGEIAEQQPRGEGRITCEEFGHPINGDTESPSFWENGTYTFCPQCAAWKLSHVEFAGFHISMLGERKKYPLTMKENERG